jgi:hypothetical protein
MIGKVCLILALCVASGHAQSFTTTPISITFNAAVGGGSCIAYGGPNSLMMAPTVKQLVRDGVNWIKSTYNIGDAKKKSCPSVHHFGDTHSNVQ